MESICALLATVILIFPLIIQLQMLIADPKKLCTIFHYYATTTTSEESDKTSSLNMLQQYPKDRTAFNVASSNSKILLTNLRTVSSSPNLIQNDALTSIPFEMKNRDSNESDIAEHSSTFVKTGQVLPIVDITWNYNSFRFKTFEECLRNCYGDKYPPGEVVLNSMQLNLLDSYTNVTLDMAGLFDFAKEESESHLEAVETKQEIEYLDPLDHFVTKQHCKPATIERFTKTDHEEDRHSMASWHDMEEDDIGAVITGREKNQPNRRSFRKIEAPRKCYLSSSRRVCRTNDS
ncbi:hypothetical protein APICC_09831 [Apis cerana cerana]|uniref:Uncharacterized protein n=1 Tax=Apis cerana cerana TaxID=94128 RepID=A0A2A3EJC0_APICC|nr:hypothetical protein APICC_09831 [Apis cerana cerana]